MQKIYIFPKKLCLTLEENEGRRRGQERELRKKGGKLPQKKRANKSKMGANVRLKYTQKGV